MANVQVPNLPAAISLNGDEQLYAVQNGISVRVTPQQIANLMVLSTVPVGASSFATSQVGVGITQIQIVPPRIGPQGTGRVDVTFYNYGTAVVYVGPNGLTTGNGLPVGPGSSVTLGTTAAVYGLSSTGTQTIAAVETF